MEESDRKKESSSLHRVWFRHGLPPVFRLIGFGALVKVPCVFWSGQYRDLNYGCPVGPSFSGAAAESLCHRVCPTVDFQTVAK